MSITIASLDGERNHTKDYVNIPKNIKIQAMRTTLDIFNKATDGYMRDTRNILPENIRSHNYQNWSNEYLLSQYNEFTKRYYSSSIPDQDQLIEVLLRTLFSEVDKLLQEKPLAKVSSKIRSRLASFLSKFK